MATPLTMRLRILNGLHAGACIDLQPGEQFIGREADLDICIADWNESTLGLCCDGEGRVTLQWPDGRPVAGSGPAAEAGVMLPFQPVRLGDIVLCVGPAEADWPTDMELLARAFEPKPAGLWHWVGSHARQVVAGSLSGAMVLVAATWFAVGLVQTPSEASAMPLSRERVAGDLRTRLAQAGQRGLEVHLVPGGLEVSGLTDSRDEARAVRQLLSSLPGELPALPRFAVAQELAETLRSSIGIPGAQVRHLGGGRFAIEAEVRDYAAARASIDRVVADLAPHVRHVEFTEIGGGRRLNGQPVVAAYSDGHTSIVQTRDGAIHLVVTSPGSDVNTPRRPAHR